MELVFQCPRTGENFSTEEYSLVDNEGVVSNQRGEKVLKAKVAVTSPCPHCRQFHIYRAEDLACPLTFR